MSFLSKLFSPDIFDCIEQGKFTRIEKVISYDKTLANKQNGQGNTPLMHAIEHMQLPAVKHLLRAGARTNDTK